MSVTYDPGQLQTSALMRLRFELGDTVPGQGVKPDGSNLQDEELEALLAEAGGNLHKAAANACRMLATAWAHFADASAGRVREARSQIAERYQQRAEDYGRLAALSGASPFGGGVGGSIYAGIVSNPDVVPGMTGGEGE